jgi:hypothetical protein
LSLEKFFGLIVKLLPSSGLSGKEEAISRLDPDKIYVENVRSVLGVSSTEAERICESAARQGVFDRFIEVLCPDGVVATLADSEAKLPTTVMCWSDEDSEEIEIPVRELCKRVFYRLHEQPTASTNR